MTRGGSPDDKVFGCLPERVELRFLESGLIGSDRKEEGGICPYTAIE
ncbi:hypothetical protein KAU86_03560 [bacterium]|nr:hypothetical protein [bacterium]MCK4437005.1 hypothetical protein [bacterium]